MTPVEEEDDDEELDDELLELDEDDELEEEEDTPPPPLYPPPLAPPPQAATDTATVAAIAAIPMTLRMLTPWILLFYGTDMVRLNLLPLGDTVRKSTLPLTSTGPEYRVQ